jgi:sarcosine oxidase subunit beta
MKGKIILCRCEDVTLKDVEDSIAHGYGDIEEVKRYTGFGTGPCQGKECLSVVAAIVAERAGGAGVLPFTSRPPLAPTPLKHYAALAALDAGHTEEGEP